MKVFLKSIGLLGEAEFEVKNLTVICGENNTGKTYATYALYGFLRNWRNIFTLTRSAALQRLRALDRGGQLDLAELLKDGTNHLVAPICDQYVKMLPQIFGSRPELFQDAVFKVELTESADLISREFIQPLRRGSQGRIDATISKAAGKPLLEVVLGADSRDIPSYAMQRFVADAVAEIALAPVLPKAFIASAERTGAAIFRRELDFARTRMLEAISKEDSRELTQDPFLLLDSIQVDYAVPVQDNVDFVRGLESISRAKSELIEKFPDLLSGFEDIIGGTYRVSKDSLHFVPKGSSQRLTMTESSSAVRALLDIGFYLRHKAQVGDLLIIDEPELNLHPVNQRKLARLLVSLVNKGLRVFITTHSDYIVKEFNSLIMFHNESKHSREVRERYGYAEDERLNPDDIALYMTIQKTYTRTGRGRRAKFNSLVRAEIDREQGIAVSTFDATIDKMNEIQTELLFGDETHEG